KNGTMGPPAAVPANRTQSSKNASVWQGFRLIASGRDRAIPVARLARFSRGLDGYSIRGGSPMIQKKPEENAHAKTIAAACRDGGSFDAWAAGHRPVRCADLSGPVDPLFRSVSGRRFDRRSRPRDGAGAGEDPRPDRR